MTDYRKMYAILCCAASEAVDWTEKGQAERASALLKAALLEAEELYITGTDNDAP